MTVEEIKERYSMRDVLSLYGIQIHRNGYINCPFHTGDRTPSLKVYQKDFYCFACGAHGDVISFVQQMDHLTFKEAFQLLGGDFKPSGMGMRMNLYHARKKRDMNKKQQAAFWKEVKKNLDTIAELREKLSMLEPFSEEDGRCQMEMTRQIALYEYLQEHWGEEGERWSH
ncbi:MAG: DNA primase [Lachnospiraceae bacterium]|nr:DNA primase [Lachnospiraceae bacterium]